jgi:hypothetical protein
MPLSEQEAVIHVEMQDATRLGVDADQVFDAHIRPSRRHATRPASEGGQDPVQVLSSGRIHQDVQVRSTLQRITEVDRALPHTVGDPGPLELAEDVEGERGHGLRSSPAVGMAGTWYRECVLSLSSDATAPSLRKLRTSRPLPSAHGSPRST